MSFLGSVGSILTGGAAIIGALKGGGSEGKGAAKQGAQQSQFAMQLAQAMADPTSPLFRNLYQSEAELARKRYQEDLANLFLLNKRDVARGGPGGFITNRSRADEQFYRALALQRETDDPAKRAREILANAAGVLYNNPAYTSLAQSNVGQTQRDVLSAGVEGAGTVLGGLENIFRNRPVAAPTTSSIVGQGTSFNPRLPGSR